MNLDKGSSDPCEPNKPDHEIYVITPDENHICVSGFPDKRKIIWALSKCQYYDLMILS